jgi:hypothetical protein
MPVKNGIYFQHQIGGLCRLHAINAFFECDKISQIKFKRYQIQYNKQNNIKYNITTPCESFDIISSNQKNIISYILKQHGVYSRYFSLNQVTCIDDVLSILYGNFIFIYTDSHIYGIRKLSNGQWYIVDSSKGVYATNIKTILLSKNVGFIVPVNVTNEYIFYKNIIKNIFINKPKSYIEEYLKKNHNDRKILGDLEIPLGVCIDILEFNLNQKLNSIPKQQVITTYQDSYDIVKVYNHFISLFTNGRYNDIDLIIEYLPVVIFELILLKIN